MCLEFLKYYPKKAWIKNCEIYRAHSLQDVRVCVTKDMQGPSAKVTSTGRQAQC